MKHQSYMTEDDWAMIDERLRSEREYDLISTVVYSGGVGLVKRKI